MHVCCVVVVLTSAAAVFVCMMMVGQNMPPTGVMRPMGQQPGLMGAGRRAHSHTNTPSTQLGTQLWSRCVQYASQSFGGISTQQLC